METKLPYKFILSKEENAFFIQLVEEKYKDVIAKIYNLNIVEESQIEFEMDLPKGKEEYFNDDYFKSKIQLYVGDIVVKSISEYWNQAEASVLLEFETRVAQLFKPYNITPPEDSSFIKMFAEKNIVISEDDDGKLIAIKPDTEERYYFDNEDDFLYLKGQISNSKLIL